jgi:hypothetical protein
MLSQRWRFVYISTSARNPGRLTLWASAEATDIDAARKEMAGLVSGYWTLQRIERAHFVPTE